MKSVLLNSQYLNSNVLMVTAVGLDFFDDIFVPPHLMFPGSFL